jgi:Ni/Co efflux regulator RcnB
LLQQEDLRKGIGISNEQHQKIREAVEQRTTVSSNDIPAIQPILDEMGKLRSGFPPGRFDEDAPEEMKRRVTELQEQMSRAMDERVSEIIRERQMNAINDNLTPYQLRKVQEFQISAMSELEYVSPSMFEALDLSDDQRQQLGDIKKGMEAEFTKWADSTLDAKLRLHEKRQAEFEVIQNDDGSISFSLADPVESWVRVRKANPDIQQALNESIKSGKALADKLKVEMFDVLTDEQWKRMLNLIDNPPDYAKQIIAQMREQRKKENANASADTWQPGPNSWKPGDGVPEQYRQERNEKQRFPRTERLPTP